VARTKAQQYAVDCLKEHGASLFEPIVSADDVDIAVRGEDGQYVELRILASQGSRKFTMGRFRPKAHVFFVCVSGDEPVEAWVLPSSVFERFASGSPGTASRTLDLDEAEGEEPLAERLLVYRERWPLISQFSKFRSTLSDPVALRVRLAMG
jgi:hypothetical protein